MFHPESNPLAPKSSGPKKPEKELVRVWLGDAAAAEMDEKPEAGDEDLDSKKYKLTVEEKRALWEMKRPDEVMLKNIPTWKELPNEETFTKDFKFDGIWEEYHKGRTIEEFETQDKAEALPMAKIFEIGDVIAKAREKDPKHHDILTTIEVLKAVDKAGYRPATLEELVAYARDCWKPDADPKTLTREELSLQNAQAPCIIGLNSVFSPADGDRRYAPLLRWRGGRSRLGAKDIESAWCADDYFLALRKAHKI